MVSCAVRSCTSRDGVDTKKSSGITYHRFPKDMQRRTQWIQFVNRGAKWSPTKYSVLCCKHFDDCYKDRTSQFFVRLKNDAVPTKNSSQEKIRLLSDISRTPTKSAQKETEVSLPSTSIAVKPASSQESITTPREQKLFIQLQNAVRVSCNRKRKLLAAHKRLNRRDKRIAKMEDIINDLRTKRLMDEESLQLIDKLKGPEELFIRQIKKYNFNLKTFLK